MGTVVEAKVHRLTQAGVMFTLFDGRRAFAPMAEISDEQVHNLRDILAVGEVRAVKTLGMNDRREVEVSLKQAAGETVDEKHKYPKDRDPRPSGGGHGSSESRTGMSFEEKVKKFLRQSEDRLLDVKRSTENKRGGKKKGAKKKRGGSGGGGGR